MSQTVKSQNSEHTKPPLLGHIHVPKTAGTSVRGVLDRHFGAAHIHLYPEKGTTFVFENSELAELVRSKSVSVFSSHFVRRFPATLANRPVHYVTFLRDPVQQFISYITYTRKHHAAIPDLELLSHLPPGMPGLTIRECARWILDGPHDEFRNFRENYCTNFFARYPLLDLYGLHYENPAYKQARLDMAMRVLSEFLLVGISEQMNESWTALRCRSQEIGFELPDVPIPVENVTAAEREPLNWIHPDDEVGQKLLLATSEDKKLYEWAREQLKHLSGNSSIIVPISVSGQATAP